MSTDPKSPAAPKPALDPVPAAPKADDAPKPAPTPEIGGRKGLDPTRYGDWEKDGRCVDF